MKDQSVWRAAEGWEYCTIEGWSPLHYFAAVGRYDLYDGYAADFLGLTDVRDHCDDTGNTILHYAAIFGKDEMVARLIKKFPKKNPKNNLGETPLHYACRSGDINTVKLLFEVEDDDFPRCSAGFTPLHTSAGISEDHLHICEYLISRQAKRHF